METESPRTTPLPDLPDDSETMISATTTLPRDVFAAVTAQADSEDRSFAAVLRRILVNHYRSKTA